MPQQTNLSVSPYNDDFKSNKNFYKLLFRPGYSIQTRELNSIQSILQNQIESYGKYQFKQGDLVVPGEVSLNTRLDYVKLSSVSEVAVNVDGNIVFKKYDIKSLVGQKVQGVTSGVTASILAAEYASESSSDVLYVNYVTSGDAADESTFRQGETLEVIGGINTPLLVVGTDGSVLPTSIEVVNPDTGAISFVESRAMGFASGVKVQEGIYFVNGYFVRNNEELLIIDKYYNEPSAKVGFKILEEIVTPEQDSSLYDNSIGSSNQSAPGAHRLKIDLVLQKYEYNEDTDKNFIQILSVKSGVIQRQIKPSDYNLLETTLARRTYDESGDYIVDNFPIEIREFYQKDNNLGIYPLGTDGLVNGLDPEEAVNKLVATIGAGKAYVRGFEIVNKETKYITLNKAKDTLTRDNITLKTKGLSLFKITNLFGSVPLNDEGSDVTSYPNVFLNSVFNDGSIGSNNTEATTALKQTISRRGTGFAIDDAIKTIYIDVTNTTTTLASVTESNFQTILNDIWFIKTRTGSTPDTVDSATPVSFSKVKLKSIDDTRFFLELTVVGKKNILDLYLKEYDDVGGSKQREIFLSQSDAFANSNKFGHIVSYNEIITPVVGVTKPKNLSLIERGEGFNQNTDVVISKGKLTDGTTTYNSTFGFNYFNPVFFTRLLLDSVIPQDNFVNQRFTAGKYITGLTSGAYGVIEGSSTTSYSAGNILFVNTLYGTFLPGESIADESGNVLRIANENTVSHFIVEKRGNGYTNPVVLLDGVRYDSSSIEISTEGSSIYKVLIKNRDSVQTSYSQPPIVTISSSSTPGVSASIIPVLYKNTVLTYTPQNIKSFHASYGSGSAYSFTADVDVNRSKYSESKSVTDYTFSGNEGDKYLECSAFEGDASKDLVQGDVIIFTDSLNRTIKLIVQYATSPDGVKKSRIYLDSSLPAAVINASVLRIRPSLENLSSSSLVFPTGSKQVNSLVKDSTDSKFKYYIRRDFVTTGSSNGGLITFAAQLQYGTQRFASYNENNFLITILDRGSARNIQNGDILYINPSYVSTEVSTDSTAGLTAGSVTITLPNNFFTDNSGAAITSNFPKLKLSATIEVSKAKPRLKTAISNKRIVVVSGGDKVVPLRGQDYDTEEVEIYSYSDVYRLNYVYEGSSTNPPSVDTNGNLISGTDVTNRFTFDDGQRDTHYDVSRLILKPGFSAPVGQLVIGFDYFDHSQGDFCTVDSYLHEAGVGADQIPSFNSSVYGNVSLKDVVDFRPKADNSTIVSGFQDTTLLSNQEYVSFRGSGGVFSSTPATDASLDYTLSFSETQYLDRIDAIFLNKQGQFIVKEGNSSLSPTKPDLIDDAIALCYAFVPAFTKTSKDIRVTPVDNKRYTMRDIGKLEKRIERLEYYTTLSILEQQALNMQIKDEIGLDRFKSGFIVDNFETHKIGNLNSIDYRCSIDTQQAVLRPQVKEDNLFLQEVITRSDERTNAGYVKNNDVITLPFSSSKLLGNPNASKTLNPNPFVLVQYVGDLNISPNIDQWYDTSIAPLVSDNNTNLFTIYSVSDVKNAFASFYNSFIVTWVGASRSFFNIASFGQTTSEIASSSVTKASVASVSNISPQNNETAQGVSVNSSGNTSVISSVTYFTRSIPIKYNLTRMKPSTRYYVFIDHINVNRWSNPDTIYTGIPGNSLSSFNSPIVTDSSGNASGIILMPAGYAPIENTTWSGDINTMLYDDTSDEVRFPTGIKTIRFTSSSTDIDTNLAESYAESKFYAVGSLPQNPSGIVSTLPAIFKANEGVQIVDSVTSNKEKPSPLSQTFKIENYEGGVFVTGMDIFFQQKSSSIPVRVYLTNVDTGKPGKYIIPGTESVLLPNTYIRVTVSSQISLTIGEEIRGSKSGAYGPLASVLDKNNVIVSATSSGSVTLNNDQVYTLVLSNNNGVSFVQDESLTISSVKTYNAGTSSSVTVNIVKDSGKIVDLKIKSVGSNYESAVLLIESPQLPGGSTAAATVDVSNGKVYNVDLSLPGSRYTEPPAVTVRGSGTGASGAVIESIIEIDTPAVVMGIATDSTGTTASTTPTRFNFKHPVYLQNNTEYAFAVETDSTDYRIWASRLTDNDTATGIAITTQPSLGSVYKSQNTDVWSEDLFEDIKFTLYRAEFDISRTANLYLTNSNLGYEKLLADPIQTYALANTNATSTLFKNNNSIVKVNHRDHGFESSGKSYVFFKSLSNVGGFTSSVLNSSLFKVSNSGLDYYNIVGPNRASANSIGGGDTALAAFNRKYEKLFAHISYLQAPKTSINTYVKTTNIIPVDSNTQNYLSYSTTDYEKTFLNQEHFFTNQKVVASRINQILNNTNNSLQYKLELSSTASYLSPVIDLRVASVKLSSNRVESPSGKEDRFGKKYQVLSFLPIYQLNISGNGATSILLNQTVEGLTSGTKGEVVGYSSGVLKVKVTNNGVFRQDERLYFGLQSISGGNLNGINVSINSGGVSLRPLSFVVGSTIVAFNPSDTTKKYDNKISGKIISWDPQAKLLIIENDKYPISGDYTSKITLGSAFSRNASISSQSPDIFRIGDLVFFDEITTGEEKYYEVGEMSFTNGVDFVPESASKNSSGIAKYVTKEVNINSSGTAIDTRLTVNVKDINNIKVYYKFKPASSQENFDDIGWNAFNVDGNPDTNEIATPSNSLSSQTETQDSYQELKYSASGLSEFSSFAIKIVMQSIDPSYAPKIQDIRTVASY